MNDTFVSQEQSLKETCGQIRQLLSIKKSSDKGSITYNKTSSRLESLLSNFQNEILQMKENFKKCVEEQKYPKFELDSRQSKIEELNTLYYQVQQEYTNSNLNINQFNSTQKRFFDDEQPSNSKKYSIGQARQHQKELIEDQNRGMDALGEILSKQKTIAKDMCQEIVVQNEILEDINDIMDQADTRLIRNIKNTKNISRKSNTCGLWVLIVGLLIADVVIFSL